MAKLCLEQLSKRCNNYITQFAEENKIPITKPYMDFHLLQNSFLPVSLMKQNIYNYSRTILDICKALEFSGIICKFRSDNHRLPFFKLFNIKKNGTKK